MRTNMHNNALKACMVRLRSCVFLPVSALFSPCSFAAEQNYRLVTTAARIRLVLSTKMRNFCQKKAHRWEFILSCFTFWEKRRMMTFGEFDGWRMPWQWQQLENHASLSPTHQTICRRRFKLEDWSCWNESDLSIHGGLLLNRGDVRLVRIFCCWARIHDVTIMLASQKICSKTVGYLPTIATLDETNHRSTMTR